MDKVWLVFNWSDLISVHKTRKGAEKKLEEELKYASEFHGLGINESELEE